MLIFDAPDEQSDPDLIDSLDGIACALRYVLWALLVLVALVGAAVVEMV